ncbi:hypothetical protein C1H76_5221 [Elsinoe australis]|uniref:Uncharacterized protein n=1 Tax=Elsinoe australis TaxID=40998 RepID=A0A4U7AW78_9PEZI|nr:hypothetical protein C1H76_5221 [Elsinoe australis]
MQLPHSMLSLLLLTASLSAAQPVQNDDGNDITTSSATSQFHPKLVARDPRDPSHSSDYNRYRSYSSQPTNINPADFGAADTTPTRNPTVQFGGQQTVPQQGGQRAGGGQQQGGGGQQLQELNMIRTALTGIDTTRLSPAAQTTHRRLVSSEARYRSALAQNGQLAQANLDSLRDGVRRLGGNV